ncbi:zinc-regulated transporter 2 [Purpureocillium lavendulum]|uniref:Zinc-regulated transporter 2 n=1 Tax=Purpureocillium lavendulum TaxID=1247861 RepID=A0AB34FEQ7_9HYPO|nr:zinc-regulated transporter 2 [Purpureocillium lavendulum]
MAEAKPPKPQCGGGVESGEEYDLALHTAGLFLVLAASCIGCGFPVVAKKVKWLKIPPKIFFACKHFGTGVLIATAFVHLLPTAFASLNDPCLPDLFTDDYPALPGVIMMGSLFLLFVIEMWLNAKTGGHSHGGPTGETVVHGQAHAHNPPYVPPAYPQDLKKPNSMVTEYPLEKESPDRFRAASSIYDQPGPPNPYSETATRDSLSTMPAWFIVFYEQYVRQQNLMVDLIHEKGGRSTAKDQPESVPEPHVDEENQLVDPDVYRKMSTNITLLEGGILFHSVFVGMTVSITIDGFVILLVAILFHQMFEGLGLGSRIAAVPYPKGSIKPWLLVVAFGTTAPIGQAIGLITRGSYDPQSAFGLIIVGIFNAISSGLLIYAALVDLLAEDFLSEEANRLMNKKKKAQAFGWVLLGAAGMSIVGAFA